MQIQQIQIRDVGPFESLDLTFPQGSDPDRADVHILVGPNGTGKSTILYSIAQALTFQETPFLSRQRSENASAALQIDGGWCQVYSSAGQGTPFPGKRESDVSSHVLRIRHRCETDISRDYALILGASSGKGTYRAFNAAAFAYSAYRSVPSGKVKSLREPDFNPFEDALTFTAEADRDYRLLVDWLAITFTKRALALAAGSEEEANRHQSSISRLEELLQQVTGEKMTLELAREPLAVCLFWRGERLDLGVLPDGLKSILSWLGDLLMRLEHIPWADNAPINERSFVLLLDEIEIHLHPIWQRKLVPMFQRFFPNAQIFLATHSPFIVASAEDAFIYPLSRDQQGRVQVGEVLPSRIGHSYPAILEEVFGVPWEFDAQTEEDLDRFRALRSRLLRGEDVAAELEAAANALSARSVELRDIVTQEMRSLRRRAERA